VCPRTSPKARRNIAARARWDDPHELHDQNLALRPIRQASCGYYTAYRDMIENDLDFVLHLGDDTYEYPIGPETGRGIPAPEGFERETIDLATDRLRHALHKDCDRICDSCHHDRWRRHTIRPVLRVDDPFNPHIKYYEGDRRGYFKASVTPKGMRLDLRFVTSVKSQSGSGYTAGSWVVEDGRPGAGSSMIDMQCRGFSHDRCRPA
jgi:phosphodiesterase/alkaline phosphatase D-like protein